MRSETYLNKYLVKNSLTWGIISTFRYRNHQSTTTLWDVHYDM
jgi:hypothetical protein